MAAQEAMVLAWEGAVLQEAAITAALVLEAPVDQAVLELPVPDHPDAVVLAEVVRAADVLHAAAHRIPFKNRQPTAMFVVGV